MPVVTSCRNYPTPRTTFGSAATVSPIRTRSKGVPATRRSTSLPRLQLAGRGCEGLPRQLLVLVVAAAGEERVSRHGRERQRYSARDGDAGSLDLQHQERLQLLHQLGNEIARSLGHMDRLGSKTPEEAWISRLRRARQLDGRHDGAVGPAGARVMADWTTRIARTVSCRPCRRGRGPAPSATSS